MATAGNSGMGVDAQKTKDFVKIIEGLKADLRQLSSEHMNDAKAIHRSTKETYAAAKLAGIPVKALKAVINARALERKAVAERDALKPAEMDSFDQIRHQLGDLDGTPLGDAAVRASIGAPLPLHVVA